MNHLILPDQESKSIKEIKQLNNNKVEYLFIWDSHPKFAINPKYFNDSVVYNFSFSTINYISIFHNLDILINKEKAKINNIYIEIDPHNFSKKRYINNWLKNYKFYSQYYDYKYIWKVNGQNSVDVLKEITKQTYFSYVWNYYNILTHIKSYVLNQKSNEFLGWKAWLSELNDLESTNVRLSNTYDQDYNFSNLWFYYFEKTLQLAQDNNIDIFFIKYPLSKDYLDKINKTYYLEYQEKVQEIVKNNGIEYKVYDYSKFNYDNYSLFNDPDHLNRLGSELFSKDLHNKIKNKWK